MDIGWPELIIVLVILLLLFGSTKLPKLTRSIGESARNLKAGYEGKDTDSKSTDKSRDNKTTKV
ncbi:MAG: twin-arginine translocase TatA/TatE family subunit [Candidatus Saccharibacteria bacterium]|nr:twin-arginine translocase TatA/TatE family subunit [Candidatus Saccharibacteria bacterium]